MSDERSGEGEELEVSDGDEEGGSDEGAGARGVDEELLAASRKCDVGKMKSLLNDMGANAAFESFKEGTWGARTRVSPIHLAIKAWNSPSRVEAITLLLEHGAKVNAKYEDYDWRGCGVEETAFQMIQGTDNADLQILFLKHGADPNIPHLRDAHTMRYDGQRMEYPIHEAVISGNVAFLNALLDAGAKVDSLFVDSGQSEYGPRTNTMQTALFLACANNNLPMAQTLLERGANANLVTNHVKHENIPDTESGTDDPRDPNYVSKIRNVPVSEVALHRAIIDNRPDLVSLLILHGADTSPQYHEGPKILTTKQLCDQSPSPAGLLSAMYPRWTPSKHRLAPRSARLSICTLFRILATNRSTPVLPRLPENVISLIFTHVWGATSRDLMALHPVTTPKHPYEESDDPEDSGEDSDEES